MIRQRPLLTNCRVVIATPATSKKKPEEARKPDVSVGGATG
jgi:hypothetical protein